MTSPDFRSLFEAAPGLFLVVLPNEPVFTIVAVSDAYLQATRKSRNQIVGRSMFEIFPDDSSPAHAATVNNIRASFGRTLATRRPDSMPAQRYDIPRPESEGGGTEERYWNPVNSPVFGSDKQVAYLIHRVEDVTEFVRLKREQEEVMRRESEAKYRTLFETMDDGFCIIEKVDTAAGEALDFRYVEVNPAFARQTGVDGAVGKKIQDVFPGALPDSAHNYDSVLRTGEPIRFERVGSNGDRIWDVYAFRIDDKGHSRIAVLFKEITQRKRAEQALRVSEARSRFLTELDDATRALTDPDEITRSAAQLLGEHLHLDRCTYCTFEPDHETVVIEWDYVCEGVPSMKGRYRLMQFGVAAEECFRANVPHVVDNVDADPRTADVKEIYDAAHIRACASVPLYKDGRLVAALGAHSQIPRQWSPEEVELLHAVANRCWESIGRARSERDLRRAERRQALLLKLGEEQRQTSEPEAMMYAAAEAIGQHLKVDRVGFFEIGKWENLQFEVGWSAGRLPLLKNAFPASWIGTRYLKEVQAGRTLGISDVRTDPLTSDSRFAEIGTVSLIGAPILRNGRWHAGFYVNHTEPRSWTQDEVNLVQEVGEQTWDAIERARAETALRKSEERLNFALEAGDGIGAWDLDLETGLVYCNPRFAEFYCVEPGRAASGVPLAEFLYAIHPSDRARVTASIRQAIETGGDFAEEYRLVQRNGEVRWSFARGRAYRDEAGKPTRFPGVVFDVTERRQAEAELRRQWHLFDTALSNTPDFTYIFDLDGRFSYINRPLLQLWQKSREEAVGKNFFELEYPAELAARLQRQIREVVEKKESIRDQTPYTGPTGETRDYEYIFVPVFSSDGQVEAVAGSTRDITEHQAAAAVLRQSNIDLARANRELEEFAYVASHDLQEPLRMVNIYTHLILRQIGTVDPKIEQYAEFVRQGVKRMELLFRDLLTFSRTVHEEEIQVGAAELSDALREAISVLKDQIENSGAVITAGPLPLVHGDITQMSHVFQNLLSNALKYCNKNVRPEIRISAEQDGGRWIISVRDNGIGFLPQYAERIFGLFKRLHKDEYPGTGLGLAICQRIIERCGGRIWAEGRLGTGATFFFSLPQPKSSSSTR